MQKVWVESLRSSKTLLVIFIAFVVCWTPYAIVTALDVENAFPMELHLFITLLAHLHSSLNFTIYMSFNKTFRRTVMTMLCCRVSSRSSRSSMGTSETSDSVKSGSKFSHDLPLDQKNAYTIKSGEPVGTLALRPSKVDKLAGMGMAMSSGMDMRF
ncbi:hypothetical protein DPMN_025518 [Dreissena polymorpha]|uniref:G-protein coupled receptors family 1 profile domain-containing protein n=2 Tax=Dreissena polymorpha TaxID=45954 RepID=A0A9D4LR88_DREPO|nr:hypothetical protein DPMN_025518 [Dreissena polymorpha]